MGEEAAAAAEAGLTGSAGGGIGTGTGDDFMLLGEARALLPPPLPLAEELSFSSCSPSSLGVLLRSSGLSLALAEAGGGEGSGD